MGTMTFTLEAGALVRGTVIRSLRSFCWNNQLDIDVQEDKGFFESLYRVRIMGTEVNIRRCMNPIENYLNDVTNA